jgi:hypothetical protein
MFKNPKLLVVGHARHGKDTVCEILASDYGFTFESSSRFCSKLFIFDQLKSKYGYANEEECYADRMNHRSEWFSLIQEFNREDKAKLGKAIFDEYDIYCGLRNNEEFEAMDSQKVFNFSVWVDRSKVLPLEPFESMTLNRNRMMLEVDNNGTLDDLKANVSKLIDKINFWWAWNA